MVQTLEEQAAKVELEKLRVILNFPIFLFYKNKFLIWKAVGERNKVDSETENRKKR